MTDAEGPHTPSSSESNDSGGRPGTPDASKYDLEVLRLEYQRFLRANDSLSDVRRSVLDDLRQFPTVAAGIFTLFLVFRPDKTSTGNSLLYVAGAVPFIVMVVAAAWVLRHVDPTGYDPGSQLNAPNEAQWLLEQIWWGRVAMLNLGSASWRRVRRLRTALYVLLAVEVVYLVAITLVVSF